MGQEISVSYQAVKSKVYRLIDSLVEGNANEVGEGLHPGGCPPLGAPQRHRRELLGGQPFVRGGVRPPNGRSPYRGFVDGPPIGSGAGSERHGEF